MSWNNFSDQNPDDGMEQSGQEQTTQTTQVEPRKLIDSVKTLDTLNTRTKDLAAKILSDADSQIGLSNEITNLNISEVNKATSKDTTYKTEEDITDAFMNKILNHDNDDILKGVSQYTISSEREKRYDIYEQILDSNYIAFRILRAYLNGVLIKNAQTKTFLTINLTEEKEDLLNHLGKDIGNSYKKFNKSILIKYRLQQKLKDVLVPKTLLYGNYFVEIVDLNLLDNISKHEQILLETSDFIKTNKVNLNKVSASTKELLTQKRSTITEGTEVHEFVFESNFECYNSEQEMITEMNTYLTNLSLHQAGLKNYQAITESDENNTQNSFQKYDIDSLFEDVGYDVDLNDIDFLSDNFGEGTNLENSKYDLSDISKLDFTKLKDIHLNYISPRNVIIIEKDGYVYGYLVIEDLPGNNQNEMVIDSFKRFSSGINNTSLTTKEETKDVTDQIVEKMTKEILNKVVHNIRLNKKRSFVNSDFDYFNTLNISDEALTSLKILIYSKIKKKSKLKFRFLTPESMVNFSSTVDKFAPYGTSVFDPIVGPVKLYSLALMSSVVSRLSRAAVMRKWTIETGGKRNHKEIVEKTKQELKAKSISYDKINTLQNISEIVTDFRDLASISINGQKYIDMEIMPMHDRGLPLNDLNDLKNDIISAGGVPAVYLNMGDTVDLRETLVHLNVTFANDIIDKQLSIEVGLNSISDMLFKKVLKYNGYEDGDFYISNYCNIRLNPPLVLQIQADEAQISTVSNILQLLDAAKMQIDPKDIFEKYIPSIDWKNILKKGETYVNSLGKNAIINAGSEGGDMSGGQGM